MYHIHMTPSVDDQNPAPPMAVEWSTLLGEVATGATPRARGRNSRGNHSRLPPPGPGPGAQSSGTRLVSPRMAQSSRCVAQSRWRVATES